MGQKNILEELQSAAPSCFWGQSEQVFRGLVLNLQLGVADYKSTGKYCTHLTRTELSQSQATASFIGSALLQLRNKPMSRLRITRYFGDKTLDGLRFNIPTGLSRD
jgi:hypothetical protein